MGGGSGGKNAYLAPSRRYAHIYDFMHKYSKCYISGFSDRRDFWIAAFEPEESIYGCLFE